MQDVNLFVSGGQRFSELEFDLTGPSLSKLESYAGADHGADAGAPAASSTSTRRCRCASRSCASRSRARRRRSSASTCATVADALRTLVGGEPVSKFREEQEQFDVWLRAERSNRGDPRAIGDVTIATPSGELVRLANLASLERGARPGADRPPQPPAQGDRGRQPRRHRRSAPASSACATVIDELDLPPDYGIVFGGRAKTLGETGTNFLIAFVLSFLFMYMILAAQFESFVHPITILLALPLSIPFALASLLLLGETLNIYACSACSCSSAS